MIKFALIMAISIPSYQKIKTYFYTNFALSYSFENELDKLFFEAKNVEKKLQNVYDIEPIFFTWKNYKFPVFIYDEKPKKAIKNGKVSFDVALNSFLFLSGWLEMLCGAKDKHQRFPFEASLQKKYAFYATPVVNIYFELLYEVALQNQVKIERKSLDKKLIFTHDIDFLRSGWFNNILHYAKVKKWSSLKAIAHNLVAKIFALEDEHFTAMHRMLAIDKAKKVDAISFFLHHKSHQDADFDLHKPKFLNVLQQSAQSQTIGLHPSYHSFDNETLFQTEKKGLEKLLGKAITQSRQHFLRYNINKTPYVLEKANISVDYSLGFAEHYGFRNSIASPFYLFNFKEQKAFTFLSVPLAFMDVSLSHYKNSVSFQEIIDFVQKTKENFNCSFSILFHNTVFTKGQYADFEAFYLQLLALRS